MVKSGVRVVNVGLYRTEGWGNMFEGLLIVISVLVALVGAFNLSEATKGVGIIAIACLLAIYARIAQAYTNHSEVKALLGPECAPKNLSIPDKSQAENHEDVLS